MSVLTLRLLRSQESVEIRLHDMRLVDEGDGNSHASWFVYKTTRASVNTLLHSERLQQPTSRYVLSFSFLAFRRVFADTTRLPFFSFLFRPLHSEVV